MWSELSSYSIPINLSVSLVKNSLSSIFSIYVTMFHIHSNQGLVAYLQLNCKIKVEQSNSQIRLICLSTTESGLYKTEE